MTIMLPIIEQLANAPDHSVRAKWLLRAPEYVLSRDQVVIRSLLAAADFTDGLTALNAEIAASSAVRDETGVIPNTIRLSREYARIGLTMIVRMDTVAADV